MDKFKLEISWILY